MVEKKFNENSRRQKKCKPSPVAVMDTHIGVVEHEVVSGKDAALKVQMILISVSNNNCSVGSFARVTIVLTKV